MGNFTPTHLDFETVKAVLGEYRIHNADICIRSDVTVDELIDVIEGNRYPIIIKYRYGYKTILLEFTPHASTC